MAKYDRPIKFLKLYDLEKLALSDDRTLYRITGNIDLSNSTPKELILFNEFNENHQNDLKISDAQGHRKEILIDISYLNEFNINDIHSQHDLV